MVVAVVVAVVVFLGLVLEVGVATSAVVLCLVVEVRRED